MALLRTAEILPLSHEKFCLPRPDAEAVRTESYRVPRPNKDGTSTPVTVTRCIECGAHRVDE